MTDLKEHAPRDLVGIVVLFRSFNSPNCICGSAPLVRLVFGARADVTRDSERDSLLSAGNDFWRWQNIVTLQATRR